MKNGGKSLEKFIAEGVLEDNLHFQSILIRYVKEPNMIATSYWARCVFDVL